jgi:acetoacetyl-CoA synthetase
MAMKAQLAQEGTVRLFRSLRAGREWLRTGGSTAVAPQTKGACVPMKPGTDGPPVFLIPGAPGSILQLGPLAAAMTVPQAVFAIRPRGLEEDESPCQTIEAMAEYSIARIRTMRPHGPYLLVGYSAGGLVALEMARQFRAAGDEVPLIVLLDTYPSRKIWPLRCHLEVLVRQAARAIWSLRRYSPLQMVRDARRRLRSLMGYLAASGVNVLPLPEVPPEGASAASRRVHLATYAAGEAYQPFAYAGKVVFVQPQEVPNLEPRRPASVWRRFLRDFEVCRVPGDHLGMIEAGAALTAAAISDRVREALPPPPSPLDTVLSA